VAVLAGLKSLWSVRLLVNAAAKAFPGEDCNTIEARSDDVLAKGSFYSFVPMIMLSYVPCQCHYDIDFAQTDGVQQSQRKAWDSQHPF